MLIHISSCHEKRAVEPPRRERHSVLVNLNCSGDMRVIVTGYNQNEGSDHTNVFSFENAYISMRLALLSILIR